MLRKILLMGVVAFFLVGMMSIVVIADSTAKVREGEGNPWIGDVTSAACNTYSWCWDLASGGNCCKTVAVCSNGVSSVTHCTGTSIGNADTPPMNKVQLIDAITSYSGLTKSDAGRALNSFVDATTNSLKGGNRVALVGFGSFSVSKAEVSGGNRPGSLRNYEIVDFKAGDRPFLPHVEYTTTEDIVKEIARPDNPEKEFPSGEVKEKEQKEKEQYLVDAERTQWNDINDDGRIRIAKQFMDSFTTVVLTALQTGTIVDVGDDLGTFWHANHADPSQKEMGNAEEVVMKNKRGIGHIGHVDHGKGAVKFDAGSELVNVIQGADSPEKEFTSLDTR